MPLLTVTLVPVEYTPAPPPPAPPAKLNPSNAWPAPPCTFVLTTASPASTTAGAPRPARRCAARNLHRRAPVAQPGRTAATPVAAAAIAAAIRDAGAASRAAVCDRAGRAGRGPAGERRTGQPKRYAD